MFPLKKNCFAIVSIHHQTAPSFDSCYKCNHPCCKRAYLFMSFRIGQAAKPGCRYRCCFFIKYYSFLHHNKDLIYAQTRAAIIPGNPARVIVTAHETDPSKTHGFLDLYSLQSTDNGNTWSTPSVIESLQRKRFPR
ncbi:MAG: hypothetical protein WDO16_01265 [Bacteroidota bacterium]